MTRLNSYLKVITGTALLLMSSPVFSFQNGITGYSGNPSSQKGTGQNCSSEVGCHRGGIPPNVVLEGPAEVLAGSENNHYKLVMKNGQDKIGGLNISVEGGSLRIRDGKTKLDPASLEITHIAPAKPVMLDGTTISWLFDLNVPATIGNSAIIYASLISANADGTTANDSIKTISMEVQVVSELTKPAAKPKATITAPFTAPAGVAFPLIGSKSSVADGLIFEYSWSYSKNLGNDKIIFPRGDKGEQILKSFDSPGLYTISLVVTSDKNVSSSTYFDIVITDQVKNTTDNELVPFARISAATSGVIGTKIIFSSDQSIPSAANLYIWDFGDDKPVVSPADTYPSIVSSGLPEITHVYSKANTYTVTLAVRGINNLTSVDSFDIIITDGTVEIQKIVTGEQLFINADPTTANTNCTDVGCHGVGGIATGQVKNIQGATTELINTAIAGTNNVVDLMVARIKNTRGLGINGIQKIADYLGNVTLPVNAAVPISTLDKENRGQLLYEVRCLLCHGVAADGVNTRGRNIQGFKQATILDAISQVSTLVPPKNPIPLMKGIHLTALEAGYIEAYLAKLLKPIAGNLVAGSTVFEKKCSMCHGTGTGGYALSVIGKTVSNINLALTNQTEMQNIKLTAVEKLDIETFLANGELPIPATGAGLYKMYCAYCHGVDGAGGAVALNDIRKNNKFTGQFIRDTFFLPLVGPPKPPNIAIMKNTSLKDPRVTALDGSAAGLLNLQKIADFLNPPKPPVVPAAQVGAVK